MSRTWTKVKAGVYTSGDYIVEKKYDRAAGGYMWRVTNGERPGDPYTVWVASLAQAKDHIEDADQRAARKAEQAAEVSTAIAAVIEAPDMRAHRLANEVISTIMADHDLSVYNAVRQVLIKEFSKNIHT